MSFKMIQAVHASRIEPRLRHLASTLAFYASDDGSNIYPGVSMLMQAMGVTESALREGLQELVESRILVRDGYYSHTRRFRFDLDRLASYEPAAVTRAAWRASRPRHAPPTSTAQTYATAKGSNGTNLRQGVGFRHHKPTPGRSQTYAMADSNLRHGVPDLNDHQDQDQDLTGAGAPAPSKTAETGTRTAETEDETTDELAVTDSLRAQALLQRNSRVPVNGHHAHLASALANPPPAVTAAPPVNGHGALSVTPDSGNGNGHGNGQVPFKVYAAMATQAVTASLRDDRDDSVGNMTEIFKRLCAQQGKPYDSALAQRAVDAALAALAKEKHRFLETFRELAGVKVLH